MVCPKCSPDTVLGKWSDTSLVMKSNEGWTHDDVESIRRNVSHIRCKGCGTLYNPEEWEAIGKNALERMSIEIKECESRPPRKEDYASSPLMSLLSEQRNLSSGLLVGNIPHDLSERQKLYAQRRADTSNRRIQKLDIIEEVAWEKLVQVLPKLSPEERSIFHYLQLDMPPEYEEGSFFPKTIFTVEEIARIVQVPEDVVSLELLNRRLEKLSRHGIVTQGSYNHSPGWVVNGRSFLPKRYREYLPSGIH